MYFLCRRRPIVFWRHCVIDCSYAWVIGRWCARRYTHVPARHRHPGRDCRDPDAMDGNLELRKPTLI